MAICISKANVKIISSHAGFSAGPDGATHQALEDVAALRSLPGITIVEPCDYQQALQATKAAANWQGPVYLRLHRLKTASITAPNFIIGQAQVLQKGEKLTIIASGPVLNEVLSAAKQMSFTPEIINCPTIKPLDEKTILNSVKKTNKVLVIQDHQIIGGLGSAVAELLAEKYPVKIKVIGMPDKFGESGKPAELWLKYGLSASGILRQSLALL